MLAVENFKGSLPLLIISHFIDFETIGTILEQNFEDVFGTFVNIKFDFMVFDETYKVSNTVYFCYFFKLKTLNIQNCIQILYNHNINDYDAIQNVYRN